MELQYRSVPKIDSNGGQAFEAVVDAALVNSVFRQ